MPKTIKSTASQAPTYHDYRDIIIEMQDLLRRHASRFQNFDYVDDSELARMGYGNKSRRTLGRVILAQDAAIELGAPDLSSTSITIWTKQDMHLRGKIWLCDQCSQVPPPATVSYLQCGMLRLSSACDPMTLPLSSALNLGNEIDGLMSRTLQNRVWMRVHRQLVNQGIGVYAIAQALARRLLDISKHVLALDLVIIAGDEPLIQEFASCLTKAQDISRENRRIQLQDRGISACGIGPCNTCEDQQSCDVIKAALQEKGVLS